MLGPGRCMLMMMRAVVVDTFGDASAKTMPVKTDVAIPTPGPDQVLVRVYSAGVNPVDTYVRSGKYSALPDLPYTPGKDLAGVVESVGPGVTGHQPGSRVFATFATTGSLAEFALVQARRCFPLPDQITFDQGACLGVPYFTAYRALFHRGRAKKGETVLIHGASGAVGLAAVQLAAEAGLRVFGTAGTEDGMTLVKDNGAETAFNHREEGYAKKMKEAFGDHQVDLILEMLANVNLETDLDLLNVHGRVAIIGSRGSIQVDPRKTMAKETDVLGIMLGRASETEWVEMNAGVERGCRGGWIKPVVGRVYEMERAFEAHRDVVGGGGTLGNLVVRISEPTC